MALIQGLEGNAKKIIALHHIDAGLEIQLGITL
jgi:hypothetical protein